VDEIKIIFTVQIYNGRRRNCRCIMVHVETCNHVMKKDIYIKFY